MYVQAVKRRKLYCVNIMLQRERTAMIIQLIGTRCGNPSLSSHPSLSSQVLIISLDKLPSDQLLHIKVCRLLGPVSNHVMLLPSLHLAFIHWFQELASLALTWLGGWCVHNDISNLAMFESAGIPSLPGCTHWSSLRDTIIESRWG